MTVRSPTSRDMLGRSTRLIQIVHHGLLTWCRKVLEDSQLQDVEVYGEFPVSGQSRAYLTLFPYSLGPAPQLMSSARPSSLLGNAHNNPKASGLPQPWGQLGNWLTRGLLWTWPRPVRHDGPPLAATAPLDVLPPQLATWYADRPHWRTLRGEVDVARLPSFWWHPGIDLRYDYVVTGAGGTRGTLGRDREPSALLLGALSALAAAGHHEGGFDVQPPWPAVKGDLASFCVAMADALAQLVEQERTTPSGDPRIATELRGIAGVSDGLRDAAEQLGGPMELAVSIIPSNDLSTTDMFSLMQALGQQLQAASCFKLQLRLGEVVEFAPSAEIGVHVEVFPRFRYDVATAAEASGGDPGVLWTREDPA